MPERIRIKLFGPFDLSGIAEAPELSGRKLRALLAYFALKTKVQQPRERLMALLWGSQFETQGRQHLRQALSRPRRSIGDALVVTGEERVGVNRKLSWKFRSETDL